MNGQLITPYPPADTHLICGTQLGSEQTSSAKKIKVFHSIPKCTLDVLLLRLKYIYLPTDECNL